MLVGCTFFGLKDICLPQVLPIFASLSVHISQERVPVLLCLKNLGCAVSDIQVVVVLDVIKQLQILIDRAVLAYAAVLNIAVPTPFESLLPLKLLFCFQLNKVVL